MSYQNTVNQRVKRLLEQHPHISIEFKDDLFSILMENLNPNLVGNFTGGDMAYAANVSAGFQCVADGVISQTASINIECIGRGDGNLLVAESKIIHQGRKLIRMRCNVHVRNADEDKLVAIAQINMSPVSDQKRAHELFGTGGDISYL